MQPLVLTLQAFGPFADCQTVDFTQLGDAPLFLINGATGAGKSTLLDALCFALYGQTSGKERDAAQMRCDHSPADLVTEVTFTFKLGDAIYKIERQPQQERAKARGEGTTTQSTDASLWQLNNGEPKLIMSKSASQVNQYIETLTGLDANQFRQVMVLPQGKFREFLLADSNEREKLFETLFQTSIYSKIQDALKEQANLLEKSRHDLKLQESLILEPFNNAPDQTLAALCEQQKTVLNEVKNSFDTIKTERDRALQLKNQAVQLIAEFSQLEKNQTELDALKLHTNPIDQVRAQLLRAQQAERIASVYTALNSINTKQAAANVEHQQLQNNIANSEQNLTALKKIHQDAQALFNKCQYLPEKISQLKMLLPKVDELLTLQQQHLNAEKNMAACLQTNEQQQTIIDKTRLHLQADQKTQEKLKLDSEQLPYLKQQLEQCESIGKQLKNCENIKKILADVTERLKANKHQQESISQQYQRQKTQTLQLELTWHNQQAAFLASQLQQNKPCPVCGSCDHPTPATDNQQPLIERLTIETARQALDATQQQLNSLNNTQEILQAEYLYNEKALSDATQVLTESPLFLPDNTKTIDDYRADYKTILDHINTLEKNKDVIKVLSENIKDVTLTLAKYEQSFVDSQQQYQQAVITLELAKHSVLALENSIEPEWRKPQALAEHIAQLERQFTQAETTLKGAEHAIQQQQVELSKVQAASDQHQQYVNALIADQADANKHWQTALERSAFVDQTDFLTAQLDVKSQADLSQQIENHQKALNHLTTLIEQQCEKINNQPKPDMQKMDDHFLAIDNQHQTLQQQWQQEKNQLDNIVKAQLKLAAIAKQLKDIDQAFALYGTLSEAANGKNAKKLSLQRFVLGVLLDDVLIEASERLIKMSKGRYRLLRNQDRAKGNRASGLELIVEDNHTGKTRNANTLSGGESFMAALALALGLSDVVQAYAGGIKLDALFIDEGFGSLDEEALDLAMQTLIDLQSSGRMIGIISHVSELKEQIAVRIDVLHRTGGNTIVMHSH